MDENDLAEGFNDDPDSLENDIFAIDDDEAYGVDKVDELFDFGDDDDDSSDSGNYGGDDDYGDDDGSDDSGSYGDDDDQY